MLTVTLHYSPAIVRRSVFAYLRRGIGTGGLVSLGGGGAAALYLVVAHPTSWYSGVVAGGVAILAAVFVGLYFLHYRQGMAKLARMGQPDATLRLTETELVVSSQAGSFSAPWSTFTALWQFKDLWLLLIGNGQFLTLPLADLSDEARSFIASRVGVEARPPA